MPQERKVDDTMRLRKDELVALGVDSRRADQIMRQWTLGEAGSPTELWRYLVAHVLRPELPFPVHRLLFERTYADWNPVDGPPPAWFPAPDTVRSTNLFQLMQDMHQDSFADLHAWSVTHRDRFWDEMIHRLGIRFMDPYQAIRSNSNPEQPDWLPGARLNIVDSCFSAAPDAVAMVRQDLDGTLHDVTYAQLQTLTDQVAHGVVSMGLQPGDAVGVDLPMSLEAVAIYLGIIKAGCVTVAVADSLAPAEIHTRLELGRAQAVFTQDYLARGARRMPLYEKVVQAGAPRSVVLACDDALALDLRPGDLGWDEFLGPDRPFVTVPRAPGDTLSLLFSSGTTGTPKAIPWTQTTPLRCAADAWLHHDIQPAERIAWPSSLGWMMGPWLIFASLINRATMALSCHPPNGRGFGRFVQDARVNILGLVPSLVRIWRNSGCMAGLDWSAVKAFSSTGECSNPTDMLFLMSLAGYKPIVEYCGGTEIGGAYITGTLVQPASPGTFSTPALGLDIRILDDAGRAATRGEVFIVPPSIGLSNDLVGADHHQVYYADVPSTPDGTLLRRHGDEMEILGAGYYRAHGRVDDTMNLHGIKVSAAEIERVVATVEGIHDAAAVSVPTAGGGPEDLVVFVTLDSDGVPGERELKSAVQRAVRSELSATFRVADVRVVQALPRTASNKIMRRSLRDTCMGREVQRP